VSPEPLADPSEAPSGEPVVDGSLPQEMIQERGAIHTTIDAASAKR
jgi:hypothetical protein